MLLKATDSVQGTLKIENKDGCDSSNSIVLN